MQVVVRGRKYTLKTVRLNVGCRGECDPPTARYKAIKISPNIKTKEEELLEVIIHELLHAAFWDLSEETVEEVATDLARILHRQLGCKVSNLDW